VGWAAVLGFGVVFAFLAVALVWIDVTFSGVIYNSEQFNTAGRSISTGLLAVDLVSHWTWASILLQSVSYGQFYGITGNYWYAVNDVVVMWLFAVVALELKHRAPKAHTMLARTCPLTPFLFFRSLLHTCFLMQVECISGVTDTPAGLPCRRSWKSAGARSHTSCAPARPVQPTPLSWTCSRPFMVMVATLAALLLSLSLPYPVT